MKTTILISLSWLMCSAAWAVESPPPLFLEQGDPNLSAPMQSFVQHVSTRADTIRSRVATMNWAGLSGDVLTLNPFPDVLLTADKTDIGFSGSRYSCWQGTLRNGKGTVALVMNGDRISGTISSVDGIFDLCPMEGGSCAIIEREPSSIPECGTGQAAMSQRVSVPIPDEGDVLPGSSPLADGDQGDTPTANRIRVLVAYTSSSQTKNQTD